METSRLTAVGIRFSIHKDKREVARAYLYLLTNDLHVEPFGLLEDVHVDDAYRGAGIGRDLLHAVVEQARAEKCYKLIATSRNDGARQSVHDWYVRLGFREYGTEFRMDL